MNGSIENQGVSVHFETAGNGPPLVVMAGLSFGIEEIREYGYLDALSESFKVIAIEPRGHGQSSKPENQEQYTLDKMVSDIIVVLDSLDIASAHYFGYSMGGRIGFGVAGLFPERIRGISIGGADPYQQDSIEDDLPLSTLSRGHEAWIELFESNARLSSQCRDRLKLLNLGALMAFRRQEIEWGLLSRFFQTMQMPCLLLAGDSCFAADGIRRAHTELANSRLLILEELNHFEAFARSELVTPHIIRFVEQVEDILSHSSPG